MSEIRENKPERDCPTCELVAPVLAAETEAAGVRPRMQRLASPAEARANALYPPNMAAFHGIEDACAYNPLPSLRMEQFFTAIEPDREGKTNVAYGGAGVGPFHDPASLSHPLCDLFGIRFILTDQPVAAIPTPPTLFGRTSSGIALNDKELGFSRITFLTICQFPR